MLNKLIFLHHGGGTVAIPGQTVPAGASPIPAITLAIVAIAILVGLWILFTKKRSI